MKSTEFHFYSSSIQQFDQNLEDNFNFVFTLCVMYLGMNL